MSTEYSSSYYRRMPHPPDGPWISQVAGQLEGLAVTGTQDSGIVIELAIVNEEDDSITVTLFDLRRRSHRRYIARRVTATYTKGFTPELTPLMAANLIALEVVSSPGEPD